MRLWRRKVRASVREAVQERQESERRLEEAKKVTHPLAEMHRQNHIAPLIQSLITRRAQEEK